MNEADSGCPAFDTAKARVPAGSMLFNNTCQDILLIAEQIMLGELEYRMGNGDAAFAHLRRLVEMDGAPPYDEHKQRLGLAATRADVPIGAFCYCQGKCAT
jgi:hypothetical protein